MRVTVLDPSYREIIASVIDVSDGGLCLWLLRRIPAGTPVKVETADTLLLGDICYCRPDGEGYRVGFVVKHRMALEAVLQQQVFTSH